MDVAAKIERLMTLLQVSDVDPENAVVLLYKVLNQSEVSIPRELVVSWDYFGLVAVMRRIKGGFRPGSFTYQFLSAFLENLPENPDLEVRGLVLDIFDSLSD